MPTLQKDTVKLLASKMTTNRGSLAAQQKRVREMIIGKKNNPERLKRMVKYAAEMPVMKDIARRAAISTITLRKYLKDSEDGLPGYDLKVDGETKQFHELFAAAMNDGVDKVESAALKLAYGEKEEILTHHGRVQYKVDPVLIALGYSEYEAVVRDPVTGEPVPETVPLQDPDMIRFILKNRRREVYGDHTTVDMNHRGGVLVVGVQAKTSADLTAQAAAIKATKPVVEFIDDDDEAE